ncbi:MAG TPA: flagellar hook capping FlgD N-terminal domain-containing protein [Kaistiaceae bacterium]|nr:flagellar hook capping FlgD N-terminal domain-containing protein [Kaistiaceae bacterium]
MSVASVASAASSATSTSDSSKSRQTLANNFETFLTLLTTQLKAQSPLDPMDTNQFTQELVQFSQVEQQINMNSNLESLISLISQQTSSSIVGYLGTNVTAEGATTELSDGKATWNYNSPQAADGATITIRNASGTVVYTDTADLADGAGTYTWNGRTSTGSVAADGRYTITIDARTSDKKVLDVNTSVTGRSPASIFPATSRCSRSAARAFRFLR